MAKANAKGGIGFTGALFIVLLVLKLCGVINWSWWWIAAPLWVPAALILLILAVLFWLEPWLKHDNRGKP